jgi:hypothetical protein
MRNANARYKEALLERKNEKSAIEKSSSRKETKGS